MKKLTLVIAIAITAWSSKLAAQEYGFGSAQTQAVGGVVTLVPSSPSVSFSHPAMLGFTITQTSAEVSYRQLFGLSELEDVAVHAAHRFRLLSGGLSITRFGEAGLYQEYTVSGAIAYRIRTEISVGTTLRYSSAEFGDGQSRYAGADLALSASYRPVAAVLASASIYRVSLDRIYDDFDTDPVYEASIAWTSPSEVALGAIWTRERPGEHRFALGQVLNLSTNLDFLAGLRFEPVRYTLGGRAHYQGMSLVYAYEGHSDLGATHSFGFSWSH